MANPFHKAVRDALEWRGSGVIPPLAEQERSLFYVTAQGLYAGALAGELLTPEGGVPSFDDCLGYSAYIVLVYDKEFGDAWDKGARIAP